MVIFIDETGESLTYTGDDEIKIYFAIELLAMCFTDVEKALELVRELGKGEKKVTDLPSAFKDFLS